MPIEGDIEVRVVSSGDPVPGATVHAMVGDRRADSVTTGADGKARLAGIPDGEVLIVARHEAKGKRRSVVTVGPQRAFELPLEGASIRVQGLVTWEDGVASDVPVYIVCAGLGYSQTRTDPTGRYEFRGCEPGHLVVEAFRRDLSLDQWQQVVNGNLGVDLRPGEVTRTVDLRVRKGGERLGGQVITPTGSGAPDVTVMVQSSIERWSTLTDIAGRFEFFDLAAGEYELRVDAAGFPRVVTAIMVPALQDARVQLVQGATLRGRVVDEGGSPRAFTRLLASGARYRDETHTASSGSFIVDGLLPGEYRLYVRHLERGDIAVASVSLGAGEDKFIDVVAPLKSTSVAPH